MTRARECVLTEWEENEVGLEAEKKLARDRRHLDYQQLWAIKHRLEVDKGMRSMLYRSSSKAPSRREQWWHFSGISSLGIRWWQTAGVQENGPEIIGTEVVGRPTCTVPHLIDFVRPLDPTTTAGNEKQRLGIDRLAKSPTGLHLR